MKISEPTVTLRSFWSLPIRACLLALLSATMLLQVSHTQAASSQTMGTQYVYFGTYTGAKSKGIYRSLFDPATGKLGPPELAAQTPNPTFLALDPRRRFLYAVNEVNDFGQG